MLARSPKTKRLPADTELTIHKALVQHLRMRGVKGVFWFHPPNGESRSARTGDKLKRMGVIAGVPDLVLIINGRPYGLEIKSDEGRQSPEQKAVAAAWMVAGGHYEVVRGIDAGLALLEGWGALKPMARAA